jgi:hypothetical protein
VIRLTEALTIVPSSLINAPPNKLNNSRVGTNNTYMKRKEKKHLYYFHQHEYKHVSHILTMGRHDLV